MDVTKQVSWVMVRTIGFLLLAYSLIPLIAIVGNGYMAYTLRDNAIIISQSNEPIPEYQKNTPLNRQLQKIHSQAVAGIILNSFIFVMTLSMGIYCFKRGELLQKILMPPKEIETENT